MGVWGGDPSASPPDSWANAIINKMHYSMKVCAQSFYYALQAPGTINFWSVLYVLSDLVAKSYRVSCDMMIEL